MRTIVAAPEGWERSAAGERVRYGAPGGAAWLEVGPLEAMPEDRLAWSERVLGAELPPGGRVEQLAVTNATTELGWPFTLVETAILDATGAIVEHRLTAFYEFLLYGATVVLGARDAAKLDRGRSSAVAEVFTLARPDLRGGPVARIDELFDV